MTDSIKNMQRVAVLVSAACSALIVNANSPSWAFESSLGWESRYVAEGRDELDRGGIFTADGVVACQGFSFAFWSALGDRVHYQELQLTSAYTHTHRGWDFSAGWTHLEFNPDSGSDDELFIEMARVDFAGFELTGGWVYSFEAGGSFLGIALKYPIALFEEKLLLEPYVQENVDFGYRTAGHDGLNNLQAGVDLSYALNERFTMFAFLAHSWAQNDVRREGLSDLSWGGWGLRAFF